MRSRKRNEFKQIKTQEQILKLREKIERTQDHSQYTKEEMALMEASYHEITGHIAPSNCQQCLILFTILRNWFKKYDQRTIEPIKKPLKPAEGEIEKLQAIATEKGIKFRKNASIKTLKKLIDEHGD